MDTEGSKQALGLMNKKAKMDTAAVDDEEGFDMLAFNPDDILTNKTAKYNSKTNYALPPDEDYLTNNTLWPEANKFYGHGYEIISSACTKSGKIIASGGKSQAEKHSKLFLWDVAKSSLIAKLDGHELTIVQIEFSPNDEFILTVSRDRSWCLYSSNDQAQYQLIQSQKECHARIIWGCSWSFDGKLFATGSRDKSFKIWERSEVSGKSQFNEVIVKELKDSVTSVNIVPRFLKENLYVLIAGLESGEIQFYSVNVKDKMISHLLDTNRYLSHSSAVRRIKSFFDNDTLRVASCSDDHSLRIFDLEFNRLDEINQNQNK